MAKKKDNTDIVLFKTNVLTSIENRRERIKTHFILLRKIENLILQDPEIAHKIIYVEIDRSPHVYKMDFSAFYINVTLWLFNVVFHEPIEHEDVYDMSEATGGAYVKIMDAIIYKFISLGHDLDHFNIVGTVKEKIIRIARFFGNITANTFSLYDMMLLESRKPEFCELFNTQLDPKTMTIAQTEDFLEVSKDRLYDIIIQDGRSSLYPYVATGVVRALQMGQMFIAVGPRFDIDKSIMPVMIKQGWIHGMMTNSEFYVEAVSNRNTIIVKKKSVPASGYISRKVNIACLNIHTDSEIFDCGTTHTMPFFVKSKKHLELVEGKYYIPDPKAPHLVHELSSTDKHLIGDVIQLRSHTRCITGHKFNKVCSVCLGNKHKTLQDSRIGGLVGIIIFNPLTQLGLSAKHAVQTSSQEIDSSIVKKYFTMSEMNIYPRKEVINKSSLHLIIPLEVVNDILSIEIIDGKVGEGIDLSKTMQNIMILNHGVLEYVNLEDKTYMINISDKLASMISNQDFHIRKFDEIVKNIGYTEFKEPDMDLESEYQDMEFIELPFSHFDSSEEIFNVKFLTEEVSRYLKDTKSIIDGAKTSTYSCVEDAIEEFAQIIFAAKIRHVGMLIHLETLFMNLMRDPEDLIKRPDYTQIEEPPVQLIRLTQSIQKSDLFGGLVFEDLRRQFELADLLKKRTPGIYDCFFKNEEFLRNGEEFKTTRPYLWKKEKVSKKK